VTPVVHPVEHWRDFLARAKDYELALLPWEKEGGRLLREAVASLVGGARSTRILVAIGPEGGFSESEAEQAVEAGFLTVSLGPRILRATTAGVAAVAYLQLAWREGESS
jgi:16S rRNA (uracil1498-N3)-methyltransferase